MATKMQIGIEVLDGGYIIEVYHELSEKSDRTLLVNKSKVIKLIRELLDGADEQILNEEVK